MEQVKKIKKKGKNRWHVPRRNKFDGKPAEKNWQSFVINNNNNSGRVFFDTHKNIISDEDHGTMNCCKTDNRNEIVTRLNFDGNCKNHDNKYTNVCSNSSNNDMKPYFINRQSN